MTTFFNGSVTLENANVDVRAVTRGGLIRLRVGIINMDDMKRESLFADLSLFDTRLIIGILNQAMIVAEDGKNV
jgi:hypothetical protein